MALKHSTNISVKIPSALLATIKKGDPVRIGGATGYNAVLTTDPKRASETITDIQGPAFAGGNPVGYASVTTEGEHEFTVAFAVANEDDPVYITPAGALTDTPNSGANPQFGWARNIKTATAGPLTVRIKTA